MSRQKITTPEYAEAMSGSTDVYELVCSHQRQSRGPRGMRSFTQLVRVYLGWLDEQGLQPQEVRTTDAEAYQTACATMSCAHGRPYSSGGVKNLVKAAACVHRVLVSLGLCTHDPFRSMDRIRVREGVIRNVLNEVQMQRMLHYLSDLEARTHEGVNLLKAFRTQVLAEFFYATGMRIAEAAGVYPEDLQLEEARVWVRSGKDAQQRMAYLTQEVVSLLNVWVRDARPRMLGHGDPRLFGACHDVLARVLNTALADASKALQLPRITSHCFRHSVGYHLLRGGADVRYIQAILGHQRIDATQIYTRVDKEDLTRILDTHHPRGQLRGGMVLHQGADRAKHG